MPNNFKLTGNYYVSKFGNDSWSGTSPDAPKRTIQAGLSLIPTVGGTYSLIIGAGVYNESLNKDTGFGPATTIIGDGLVIIDGENANRRFTGQINSNAVYTFRNIFFRNFSFFNIPTSTIGQLRFENCLFYSFSMSQTNNGFYWAFSNCVFINCILQGISNTTGTTHSYDKSIIINSSILSTAWISSFINSYTLNSDIGMASNIAGSSFNYNNIQGSILMNVASSVTSGVIQDTLGRYYDLSLAEPYKRGDTILKPFNFSNHRIAYPTMNASSSAVDPKFNSIEDQDFTLQADSWHIGRASDGISNIGGTKYALRRTSRISFSGSQATVDPSLIFQYDNYIISGSQVTGSITSAPIAVNTATPKVIQKVTYNGLLAFNKDTGSASGSNQNVPDFDTFTSASGNAAANPDRLVYYMRHTTGSSIPVSDAGWDNGGLWTAGQYNVFEWNTKPSIDNLGVGNGSGSFNAAVSPTFIQATYVQMQVKLRNDYLL
jgi:hypothetical protein